MRFSIVLPFIVGPLAGCDGTDTTGPCRGNATLYTCRSTDPIVVAAAPRGAFVTIEGDVGTCGFSDAGPLLAQPTDVCATLCPPEFPACGFDGTRTVSCTTEPFMGWGVCTGRRPAGFQTSRREPNDASAYFAALAELEGASVRAFAVLRAELVAHGAPEPMVSRASRAMLDEQDHTRAMGALAGRSDDLEPPTGVPRSDARGLLDVALENAVEGCVRETYGAAVGAWQARHAHDARVADAFARVARDEAEHADLAWDVHEWAMGRLATRERVDVLRAMDVAIEALRREVMTQPRSVIEDVGLPSPGEARAIFDAIERHLWSRAR